jgi:hypothetical protein
MASKTIAGRKILCGRLFVGMSRIQEFDHLVGF